MARAGPWLLKRLPALSISHACPRASAVRFGASGGVLNRCAAGPEHARSAVRTPFRGATKHVLRFVACGNEASHRNRGEGRAAPDAAATRCGADASRFTARPRSRRADRVAAERDRSRAGGRADRYSTCPCVEQWDGRPVHGASAATPQTHASAPRRLVRNLRALRRLDPAHRRHRNSRGPCYGGFCRRRCDALPALAHIDLSFGRERRQRIRQLLPRLVLAFRWRLLREKSLELRRDSLEDHVQALQALLEALRFAR